MCYRLSLMNNDNDKCWIATEEIRAAYEYLEKHADILSAAGRPVRPSHLKSRCEHKSVELRSSCAAVAGLHGAAGSAVNFIILCDHCHQHHHTRCRIS